MAVSLLITEHVVVLILNSYSELIFYNHNGVSIVG